MAFKRTGGRKCKFESLENRRMMAGDVTVRLDHGNAIITGDFFPNGVMITAGVNPGDVVVTGITAGGHPTRVNGTPNGTVILPNVINGLRINMGFGDDTVNIDTL